MPRKTILGFAPKLKDSNQDLEDGLYDIKIQSDKEMSLFLKRILSNNFKTKGEIIEFLNPSLKNLKNPNLLQDLTAGIELLEQSILNNDRILIFGDYDVDGSTSTALLINFFKDISFSNFDFFIPDRIEDGYGLNNKSLTKILQKDFNLLITLDCGTSSTNQIQELLNLGKKCLVIDHHKSSDIIPNCLIINPNRKDHFCAEFKDLCACGVLFLFLCKFFSKIKDKIHFNNRDDKNFMTKYLDLVALATVCDVMPVIGQNRIFIINGLKNINQKKCNNGILKLIEVSGISENDKINTYHFGFIIGPKINAGGRIGKSDLGTKILSNLAAKDEIEEIAYSLKSLNESRMILEKQALDFIYLNNEKIVKQIEEYGFIFQYNEDWHEGIIGILSSRIKEKYYRPTFIGNLNEEKIKASSRSVGDIDIGDFILKANENNLLITGGGHKMAGGLTLHQDKFQEFMNFGKNVIKDQCDYYSDNKEIIYDFDISLSAINLTLTDELEALQPFGNANQRPIFRIFDAKIKSSETLKDKHLKVLLSNGSTSQYAICFNAIDNEIGKEILLKKDLDFFVNISTNIHNEKKYLSINILDICSKA